MGSTQLHTFCVLLDSSDLLSVTDMVAFHQTYFSLYFLELSSVTSYCFNPIGRLYYLFDRYQTLVSLSPRSLLLVVHLFDSTLFHIHLVCVFEVVLPLQACCYVGLQPSSQLRGVHQVKLPTLPLVFLVYVHSQLNISLDTYSQFRNPSSTVTQLTATLPLLFYKECIHTHISSHLSTFTKELFQDQECSSHFITFYHISSHFITFYHISSHLSISLKSYSSIRKVHHISSHFITFHHFYQLFTKHLQPVQESFIDYHST